MRVSRTVQPRPAPTAHPLVKSYERSVWMLEASSAAPTIRASGAVLAADPSPTSLPISDDPRLGTLVDRHDNTPPPYAAHVLRRPAPRDANVQRGRACPTHPPHLILTA